MGMQPRQTAALLVDSPTDFHIIAYAIMSSGLVLLNLCPIAHYQKDISTILSAIKPDYVLTGDIYIKKYKLDKYLMSSKYINLSSITPTINIDGGPFDIINENDSCCIGLSSGSMGIPKLFNISYKNMLF
jgi:hypothetical protein